MKPFADKQKIAAIYCLSIAILMEAALYGLIPKPEQDAALLQDYAAAQETMPAIEEELHILQSASNENTNALAAYNAAIKYLPQGVGFTAFETKGNSDDWITVDVLSNDPMRFQDYIAALSQDDAFGAIAISEIKTDETTGLKIATIKIERGARQL